MSIDIVNLIETNPITRLNQDYQSKLIETVKHNFTSYEQQLFLASFYCYLNYNSTTDFLIDLDNIWKWLGFSQKVSAKRLLETQFILNRDYKVLLLKSEEQKVNELEVSPLTIEQKSDGRGGHNKEVFMLNVDTFKRLCLKAGTKKADEIHDYYI